MTGETMLTEHDVQRLFEIRELLLVLKESVAKPGNNRGLQMIGRLVGLLDQKAETLLSDLRARLKESVA